ncbi:hypothetical protein [Vitiosangium sp. GDMCC 1.1324]|uniref:hypothetical protein n=1 Tax=Vitiosangium sp. (strain GDMCC 1.1324) TaxID=2138576 RepID=UPI000D3B318A|nr:hypothetical protein [Vitiosangium sp. GDMCC 1.1324]PTL79744.1 hypothetical protein DAT35_33640 [Vitiosangium sp. GDMCC 1.1324]
MKHCGSNRWWFDDAKLVIRRERGPADVFKGLVSLAVSAGLVFLLTKMGLDLQIVFYALAAFGYGLYATLGVWEVSLHRVTGRASWRWGLGWPFFSREKAVSDTDRVRLVSANTESSSSVSARTCQVELAGVTASELLAGSDSYDEALELAEAVALHLRRGLQVDDGRIRPVEELESPDRTRARAELEARLLRGFEAPPAPAGIPGPRSLPAAPVSPPPPGCRVLVHVEREQRVVELPAPGWVGAYRLQAFVCAVLLLLPVGFGAYLYPLGLSGGLIAMMTPLLLILLGLGGFFWRRTLQGVGTTWRITVSRRGLELVRTRRGEHKTTRLAAGSIRDIDVREHAGETLRVGNGAGRPSCPMLIIERWEGPLVALGEGLPREELEWTAARLREELAALTDARRQELNAG